MLFPTYFEVHTTYPFHFVVLQSISPGILCQQYCYNYTGYTGSFLTPRTPYHPTHPPHKHDSYPQRHSKHHKWVIMSTTPLCVAFRSLAWAWVLWSVLVCIGFWGVMPVTLWYEGRVVELWWGVAFYFFITNWKTSAVSTTDWMVEAQSCVVHQTRSRWACLFYISFIILVRCLWTKPTTWSILSFTSFTEGRSRVFYM